jgi:hypothetical protein
MHLMWEDTDCMQNCGEDTWCEVPRIVREDNINADLRETGCEDGRRINCLRILSNDGLWCCLFRLYYQGGRCRWLRSTLTRQLLKFPTAEAVVIRRQKYNVIGTAAIVRQLLRQQSVACARIGMLVGAGITWKRKPPVPRVGLSRRHVRVLRPLTYLKACERLSWEDGGTTVTVLRYRTAAFCRNSCSFTRCFWSQMHTAVLLKNRNC